jgi:hypothetical protein
MPVVLRTKGYRFWFYAADLDEPPHVHVGRDGRRAKYWLQPVALARQTGFRQHELAEIERILDSEAAFLVAIWHREQRRRDHSQG